MRIIVKEGGVTVELPPKTPETVSQNLLELKRLLGCGWAGVAGFFGVKQNENNARTIRKIVSGERELSDGRWMMVLMALGRAGNVEVIRIDCKKQS